MKKTSISEFDIFVGKRLRALRQLHGDSQQSLGKEIQVTFQQIQKYEKGTNGLSHARAYEIAQHYKVKISYFSEGYEENQPLVDIEMPVLNRGSARAAQLYQQIGSSRVQKAILDVLHSLVPDA